MQSNELIWLYDLVCTGKKNEHVVHSTCNEEQQKEQINERIQFHWDDNAILNAAMNSMFAGIGIKTSPTLAYRFIDAHIFSILMNSIIMLNLALISMLWAILISNHGH